MFSSGWRNIVIDSESKLNYENHNLIISQNELTNSIPISDIRLLMINSVKTQITVWLINELIKNNVMVVFCDEKRNPQCEILGLHCNNFSAGRIDEQFSWDKSITEKIWIKIISNKILCQAMLLKKYNLKNASVLMDIAKSISIKNVDFSEANAAKLYFRSLFGEKFSRKTDCNINSALNYGYTLLLSSFNRSIVMHGYNTCKGIHHCSKSNPYNLSCDLMEPFRPFYDEYIYLNNGRQLDWKYKKELIALFLKLVTYDNKNTELQTAVEMYSDNVLKSLSGGIEKIKEVGFYG